MISKPIFKQQNYLPIIFLIAAWLLGNIWIYQWFIVSLQKTNSLNLILLTFGAIALFIQLVRTNFFAAESLDIRYKLYPFLWLIGGEVGAITLRWSLNIPQLTLICFILGSYGLLGLLISEEAWHKGLTLATVTACIVPFLVAFNSGLGFPVRVITAHAVAQALTEFHLSAASSHDIIVMENGIAQVDLPCSGMKSLWTGTVFLLGATWIEQRRLGWRWLYVAISNCLFLLAANIIRVLILVIALEVLQQEQLANILHLPLGIVGFIIASALTWKMLQKVPRQQTNLPRLESKKELKNSDRPQQQQNLNWLVALVIILVAIGQFQPFQSSQVFSSTINLPPTIATETLALTPAEADFFANPANPVVQKLRFKSADLAGSMLLVASDTWQAHHPPELCFLGNGFKIDGMNSKLINDSINARWLSLENGQLAAAYWFQSQESTTDDFVARIWDHLAQRHKTWVLVSILFDQVATSDSPEIANFSNTIYQAINQNYFNS
ncbi:MAG: exosortase O [Cyanobacteria bacterium P01_C01_bin.72]